MDDSQVARFAQRPAGKTCSQLSAYRGKCEVEEGAAEESAEEDDGDGVEDFAAGLAGSEPAVWAVMRTGMMPFRAAMPARAITATHHNE